MEQFHLSLEHAYVYYLCTTAGRGLRTSSLESLQRATGVMTLKPYTKTVHWRQLFHLNKPLIPDTHRLCLRYRISGVKKAMSRVILGGKQTTKCAKTRNRGWVSIFSQNEKILVFQNVQFEFRQVLCHYCCCRYCIHKNNNDHLLP